jgi:nicotinamide riboside kinase
MYGRVDPCLQAEARRRRYALHLLTDVDVPWVDDGTRFLPDRRGDFYARCEGALREAGHPYVILRGGWEQRWGAATDAVARLLERRP